MFIKQLFLILSKFFLSWSFITFFGLYTALSKLIRPTTIILGNDSLLQTLEIIHVTSDFNLVVFFFLIFNKWRILHSRTASASEESDDVKSFVDKLLRSERLANAMADTALIDEDDSQRGFQNLGLFERRLRERRERYQEYADNFLQLSFVALFLFTVFGGFMVNHIVNIEASSEYRKLETIKEDVAEIQELLDNYDDSDSRIDFQKKTAVQLSKLLVLIENSQIDETRKEELSKRIRTTSVLPDLTTLLFDLRQTEAIKASDEAMALVSELDEYRKKEDNTFNVIGGLMENISLNMLPLLETDIEKEDYRVFRLLSNISLSLVIAAFFIAVLKYLFSGYQGHLHQVSLAEKEELALRRFYLAWKASDGNQEARKEVLAEFIRSYEAFIRNDVDRPQSTLTHNDQMKSIQEEAMRELIKNLGKKL